MRWGEGQVAESDRFGVVARRWDRHRQRVPDAIASDDDRNSDETWSEESMTPQNTGRDHSGFAGRPPRSLIACLIRLK